MSKFWEDNAEPWAKAIETQSIASRAVTNPALVQEILQGKAASVLDVGCGEGWLARELPQAIDYFGIDGSENLIQKAKTLSSKEFEKVDYQDFPQWKPNKKFDAVVFNFSLFDENILETLKTAANFLNPNGVMIIQTLHPGTAEKDGWETEDFKTMKTEFKSSMRWYRRTLESWLKVIKEAGLSATAQREPLVENKPSSMIFILKK